MSDSDLQDVIAQVRADLQAAMADGEGSDLKFGLGDIELTLQVGLTRGGGGKVNFSVFGVGVGANGSLDSTSTNTIKIVLKPVYRVGSTYTPDFRVSDEVAAADATVRVRSRRAED